jgi:uncharacterized protein (UPF0333 family)
MVIQYIISEKKASQSLAVGFSLLAFVIVVFASLIIHLLVRNIGKEVDDDCVLEDVSTVQHSHSETCIVSEVEMGVSQSQSSNISDAV